MIFLSSVIFHQKWHVFYDKWRPILEYGAAAVFVDDYVNNEKHDCPSTLMRPGRNYFLTPKHTVFLVSSMASA